MGQYLRNIIARAKCTTPNIELLNITMPTLHSSPWPFRGTSIALYSLRAHVKSSNFSVDSLIVLKNPLIEKMTQVFETKIAFFSVGDFLFLRG